MHAAEDDHVRIRVGRLLGEPQRIAHVIGDILNFRHLIIVRKNHRVERFLQLGDFQRQRIGGGCSHNHGQQHKAITPSRQFRVDKNSFPIRGARLNCLHPARPKFEKSG